MILTVIIVNYNVKYFLEQCLYSVENALDSCRKVDGDLTGGEAEVFVVDNHSSDGSIEYLRPKFPWVQFLVNEENIGFARANNQAVKKARGKYILFLNPDTILPEDACTVCLSFMEAKKGVGAAGVRMVDGSGQFLKESRRGFPSPWVAFCKLTGLTALFPHSRLLAQYYLGHLSAGVSHPAPVLSGACLWVSKAALDKAGSFDEQFFMYGEDIDLSYRIEQAGYTNFYIAGTTILHFKGESTRKDTRYVKLFYKAMSQFRRKHFSGGMSALFNILMEAAIWLRAGLTAVVRLFRRDRHAGGQSDGDGGNIHSDGRSADRRPGWRDGNAGSQRAKIKTVVTGDPAGVAQLTAYLSSFGDRMLVSDPEQADEIILCEGSDFSFSDCIKALQKPGRRVSFKIHAGGSNSAVGSHSKEERGQTIVLTEKP